MNNFPKMWFLAFMTFAVSPLLAQSNSESTVLVYDVSNSMWGQIDGVSKVEIAREVIGDLVDDWDARVQLGLVAYGHRRQGDCSDIQEVIPVGPINASEFSRTINSLVPRGKTPLTDAVRRAAEILNFRDTRATVILVSDGIESCNADPCALARELERGGVDFTAHVVGFDVSGIEDQSQLSCLADETGGQYLTANNASELLTALQTVAAPPPPMLRLVAATSEDGPLLSQPSIVWTVVKLEDETSLIAGQAMAAPVLEASAGRYAARAEFDGGVGSIEFDYSAESDTTIRVVIEYAPKATLDGPAEVVAGSEFEVIWTGPDLPADFVAIVAAGSTEGEAGIYAYTRRGSPAAMRAPGEPGAYELRYVAAMNRKTIASQAITVLPAAAVLTAVPVAQAGALVSVTWQGPDNSNDFVAVSSPDHNDRNYANYTYTRNGNPLNVLVPDVPGTYELRYVLDQSRETIVSLPITVTPVSATLDAAPVASAGDFVEVNWQGPDNNNDFIAITTPDHNDRNYGAYTYTKRGNPVKIKLPDEPGTYELRYVMAQSRTVLARLAITVK
jgi:Ca-activated chloride channel family protein